MITGISLTIIIATIVLVFYIIDFYFLFQYDRKRQKSKKGWAWDYTLMGILMGLIILLQPVVWPGIAWSADSILGVIIQAAGILMVAISLGLHIWARRHLGQFYVERVEVQVNHQVIDTGPYALMRHPIITSFFGLSAGLFLINPAITTLLVFIYTIWDFTGSAKKEENLLSSTVPGYTAYINRTPRFLPRIWR